MGGGEEVNVLLLLCVSSFSFFLFFFGGLKVKNHGAFSSGRAVGDSALRRRGAPSGPGRGRGGTGGRGHAGRRPLAFRGLGCRRRRGRRRGGLLGGGRGSAPGGGGDLRGALWCGYCFLYGWERLRKRVGHGPGVKKKERKKERRQERAGQRRGFRFFPAALPFEKTMRAIDGKKKKETRRLSKSICCSLVRLDEPLFFR